MVSYVKAANDRQLEGPGIRSPWSFFLHPNSCSSCLLDRPSVGTWLMPLKQEDDLPFGVRMGGGRIDVWVRMGGRNVFVGFCLAC